MSTDGPPSSAAFLLTQVGSHAAMRFAERIGEHGLTPPQTGMLGLLRARPGLSQQELAEALGMLPSRVVAFVDELESAGYVERVRDGADRRRNSLELTAAGKAMLRTIGTVARAHDTDICAALTDKEHATLKALLERIAEQQGLAPGVHPGYRSLRPPAARR
jgi:DNA-binding MarR family transcriptional regulator